MAQVQQFSFRESPYLRPTQKWVCGHLTEGKPCQIGPDNRGNCRATSECQPRRDGSRWQCTRSQLAGGPCKEGPLPDGNCCRSIPKCRPVRSWRAKRGAATKWVVSVTIGLVLLCIAGDGRQQFINPGSLTSQHAELSNCGSCHGAFESTPTEWLHAAFAKSKLKEDSERCLNCHKLGDDAFRPHSIPTDTLASLTKTAAITYPSSGALSVRIANTLLDPPNEGGRVLVCGTCHSEHHGSDFNLTAMSDEGCTTCHKAQFTSFSEGHPAYVAYPYQRRTGIQFDHLSHFGKHFQTEQNKSLASKDCGNCHKPDSVGQKMLVKSFEIVCGACHGGQIEGEGRAGAKGIAVFSVPGIDPYALQDRAVAIGEWPEFAEGPVTPFMDLLLSSQNNYRAAKTILEDLDLMDLSDATEEQIGAVESLAWNVKGLFFDLRINGLNELKTRLETGFGRKLVTDELAQLTGLLPSGVVQSAQTKWFPNLFIEVSRQRKGERVFLPSDDESQNEDSTDLKTLNGTGEIDLGDDEIDLGDDEIDLGDDEIDLGDDEIDLGDDEIDLGDDEIDLGDDEEIALEDDDEIEQRSDGPTLETPVIDEDWAAAGGWYQDDDTFALRYRPVGHADIFIHSWLDVTSPLTVSRTSEEGNNKVEPGWATDIFEELANAKGPGVCIKCHSIDQSDNANVSINWRGARPDPNQHSFTKYSHESHFSLLDEKGCVTCHIVNKESDFSVGFEDRDPTTFASNFKPLEQAVCANCHQAKKATDSCLTCHNYHVGEFTQAMPTTNDMLATNNN